MALYGKALAETVPATTTGHQARAIFGQLASTVHSAYETLASYDSTGVARATGLDAGSVAAAKQYLDSTNDMLAKYYPQMPASTAPLAAQQLAQLRTAVSTTSVAVKTIDDLFSTSWLSEVGTSIAQAAPQVVGKVGEGISSVLFAFLKETWWIFAGAGVVLVGGAYAYSKLSAVPAQVARKIRTLAPGGSPSFKPTEPSGPIVAPPPLSGARCARRKHRGT